MSMHAFAWIWRSGWKAVRMKKRTAHLYQLCCQGKSWSWVCENESLMSSAGILLMTVKRRNWARNLCQGTPLHLLNGDYLTSTHGAVGTRFTLVTWKSRCYINYLSRKWIRRYFANGWHCTSLRHRKAMVTSTLPKRCTAKLQHMRTVNSRCPNFLDSNDHRFETLCNAMDNIFLRALSGWCWVG